ncbi:MAG: tetratricopeptide repeat protein [Myxococcota bacterium]|nr:tetratricopeptide repeat protein [Myxococcota bacterium]
MRRMIIAVLSVLVSACGGGDAPTPTPTRLEIEPIELGFDARTTPGDTAVINLDAQIDALSGLVERYGRDLNAVALVPLLLQRAQVLGAIEDVEAAADAAAVISDPVMRGRLQGATLAARHEWDEALARLPESGAETGAETERETIALARGEDPAPIVAAREARALEAPSFRAETELAIALTEAGRYDDADAAYRRALAEYRDVSPFPIAFVQFQRGVMWAERAGRPGRAVELYRDAVRRVPDYVVANVHLAELELELGLRDEAIARLRRIAAQTLDPEAAGTLAELLTAESPAESDTYLATASARYEHLLAEHRLAYADHATEFFLGPGADPERALALALENLANRPTERAYDLAITAALATDDLALACRLGSEIDTRRTVPLTDTLAALRPRCE